MDLEYLSNSSRPQQRFAREEGVHFLFLIIGSYTEVLTGTFTRLSVSPLIHF
jgi:hypothetical protein